MIALAQCEDALYLVDVGATADDDDIAGREPGGAVPSRPRPVDLVPEWASSSLVDVASVGSVVMLALNRRPPLLASNDLGLTWNERGGGLPRGRALALGENPDNVLYAARNRLYVSKDGGRFWRSVGIELPEILDVAWDS